MAINGDEQFLKEMKIEPVEFDEHLDAEDEAAFNEGLVKAQARLLNDAAYTIAELDKRVTELRDSHDIWRAWALMACGAIAVNVIIQLSVLWGR